MSNYQKSILNDGENNLSLLFGPILKSGSNYISKKFGQITYEKLQPKLISLSTINSDIVYTFFTYDGIDFTRMATTVMSNGMYQINTKLSHTSVPYNYLINKKKMIGQKSLFGTQYYTSYAPIIDYITNELIGCLFVGTIDSKNIVIKKEITTLNYIDDVKHMINNIFGSITLVNNMLISYIRGQLNFETTQKLLIELTEQINYKTIFITLFKFINSNFIQISSSDINAINNIEKSSQIYQSQINLIEYNSVLTEANVNYYIKYIPIIDIETNNLIGSWYLKFGPFNMI